MVGAISSGERWKAPILGRKRDKGVKTGGATKIPYWNKHNKNINIATQNQIVPSLELQYLKK